MSMLREFRIDARARRAHVNIDVVNVRDASVNVRHALVKVSYALFNDQPGNNECCRTRRTIRLRMLYLKDNMKPWTNIH
jgi:hypothetical protein